MNPHLQRASLLLEQSRYDLAEKELRRALSVEPDNAMAHAMLGLCLTKTEKFSEGQNESEQAIHLAPDEPFVFYVHSVVLSARNAHKEAKQSIEEAIGLDPYDPRYFGQLAQIELELRNWQAAEEAANEGLSLDPEDVVCTNLRAVALVKQGKNMEAQSAIDSALRRSPEDDVSHANMGWSLLEQNKPEKAMEHFREALRLNPEMEWARLGIIEAMKARYFIYRWMLNWFLWMSKLQKKAQAGVIFGAYLGYQVLRRVAEANPAIAPFIQPLLIAYVAFALMTWLSGPLFNLVLRTSRFGRLALSDEEIRTSTWVGICTFLAIAMVITFFVTGTFEYLGAGLCFALVIPPISRIYACEEGWPRNTLILISAGLLGVGLFVVACFLSGHFIGGNIGDVLGGCGVFFFQPFVYASLATQFGVGFLTSAQPRRGGSSGRLVWIIGGIVLAVLALGMVGFTGLAVVAASQPDPVLFEMPIEAKPNRVEAEWSDPEKIEADTKYALEQGFQTIGDFQLEGYEVHTERLLLNEEENIWIGLVDDKRSEYSFAIISAYEDGSQFAYAHAPFEGIREAPYNTVRNFDLELKELLPKFRNDRPAEGLRTVTAGNLESLVVELYNKDMSYLLNRGGPMEDEFKALAASAGVSLSDAGARRSRRIWREQASAAVHHHVVGRLVENGRIQTVDTDRILSVHSLLSKTQLEDLLRDKRLSWKSRSGTSAFKLSETISESDFEPRKIAAAFLQGEENVQLLHSFEKPLPVDTWIVSE